MLNILSSRHTPHSRPVLGGVMNVCNYLRQSICTCQWVIGLGVLAFVNVKLNEHERITETTYSYIHTCLKMVPDN
ncbi:hypothetical protein FIBSPDRAFT_855891 [Athelia psychrophila]|uniref:Uncharacterized protein n=1 Tax=Athelia psychrophila TaxID=1759441 RepID=A0A166NTG2_9AGAM|nr:hypothetical protein FIBSPDRAFT_855891 [Fibularhizoctonia sp. CBS 109695]